MPWWDKKLEELSKGMQQKVQFIITVLHEPPLLIFDEPFSGFDPINAELLKQEILRLRDKGHTVIFSTHNMSSVEEVCDEIALINQSKVVLSGNVHDVKRQFRTDRFELTCTEKIPDWSDIYSIAEHKEIANAHHYILNKKAPATNSEFIAHLAQQTEVRAFCEQMPSMHDIFLKVVNAK
jgi:ABC-2 type transport system ATP-binding protein